jgi:Flp pilus assembly protein TadB
VSRPAPFDTAELPLGESGRSAAVRRRRLRSQRVRRRRLLVADLGIGAALGLLCLILTPGLAIAVLVALVALAAYGLVSLVRFMRARRSDVAGIVPELGPAGVRVQDRRSSARDAWRAP